jgi:signal transduction histidine kinase
MGVRAYLSVNFRRLTGLRSEHGRARGRQPAVPKDLALLRHELFNPLHGLWGMMQLLRRSGLSGEQQRLLNVLENSARQLERLIGRIPEQFRATGLQAGKQSLRRPQAVSSRFDGIQLLEELIWLHTPAARAAGLQLMLIVSETLPREWRTDAAALRQVLENLLGNAIKFTAAGHVCLEARIVPARGGSPGLLELRLNDTGIGLRAGDELAIFEAGQRALGESRGRYAGSGLGLWLCRELMEGLCGSISYRNRPGRGSCFRLLLPAGVAPPRAQHRGLPNRMLQSLEYRVFIGRPLGTSIRTVLARLGVPPGARQAETGRAKNKLVLVISSAGAPAPSLRLSAWNPETGQLLRRTLEPPVLECTLGPLLAEMVLELTPQ